MLCAMKLPRRMLTALTISAAATGLLASPAAAAAPVLTFPVEGKVTFVDSFGAPRSGGRTHAGTDLMAPKMRKLYAVADGVVTYLKHDTTGISGNMLTITADDGWKYTYIHLNNDRPGTDDGANLYGQAFGPGIKRGVRVEAGQVVGYVGDSGNAESTGSHLHFEMHDPTGKLVNPYVALTGSNNLRVK
jgi:murein DD-endopeptidase MepM/ murein hydrolase activator NlpD